MLFKMISINRTKIHANWTKYIEFIDRKHEIRLLKVKALTPCSTLPDFTDHVNYKYFISSN